MPSHRLASAALAAMTLFGALAPVVAPTASASKAEPGGRPAVHQRHGGDLRPYTITARSVYDHDDGDAGVYGAGDFYYIRVRVGKDANSLWLDNGKKWHDGFSDHEWQNYYSDANYLLPPKPGSNDYLGAGKAGSKLSISSSAREMDNLIKNATWGSGGATVVIPPPGHSRDFTVQIEGTNGNSHVRMTIHLRLRTF